MLIYFKFPFFFSSLLEQLQDLNIGTDHMEEENRDIESGASGASSQQPKGMLPDR